MRCSFCRRRSVLINYELRQQWIDNNLTYLDAELLELYLDEDHSFMRFTWPEYHLKQACRLGGAAPVPNSSVDTTVPPNA
eukprot:scaffold14177_cov124-Isochrysis_galbana.AAC.4